jgi:hypothetical protein
MAYTTIDDPSAHFQTTLYTGSGSSTQNVVNGGNSNLQPDLVWVKHRGASRWYRLIDSQRGASKNLYSNEDDAEGTEASVTAFNSDGFSLGTDTGSDGWNEDGDAHVAWQWKANGGTATATGSESGNNPAYSAQANQTAGFSIITYTGTGAEGDVTHGLGAKPDWIITKVRNGNGDEPWPVWHKNMDDSDADNGAYAYLNTTGQDSTTSVFYEGDAISSTVVAFKGGNANVNADGTNYVMYCFRGIQGYSKFNEYEGNASTNGPFVYTGFKPEFLIIKRLDAENSWYLVDGTRGSTNPVSAELEANTNGAEATGNVRLDILSNGFKIRTSGAAYNASGGRYIYMAFAGSPFVSSKGVPTTAR